MNFAVKPLLKGIDKYLSFLYADNKNIAVKTNQYLMQTYVLLLKDQTQRGYI